MSQSLRESIRRRSTKNSIITDPEIGETKNGDKPETDPDIEETENGDKPETEQQTENDEKPKKSDSSQPRSSKQKPTAITRTTYYIVEKHPLPPKPDPIIEPEQGDAFKPEPDEVCEEEPEEVCEEEPEEVCEEEPEEVCEEEPEEVCEEEPVEVCEEELEEVCEEEPEEVCEEEPEEVCEEDPKPEPEAPRCKRKSAPQKSKKESVVIYQRQLKCERKAPEPEPEPEEPKQSSCKRKHEEPEPAPEETKQPSCKRKHEEPEPVLEEPKQPSCKRKHEEPEPVPEEPKQPTCRRKHEEPEPVPEESKQPSCKRKHAEPEPIPEEPKQPSCRRKHEEPEPAPEEPNQPSCKRKHAEPEPVPEEPKQPSCERKNEEPEPVPVETKQPSCKRKSSSNESSRVNKITTCALCQQAFTDPKELPCMHTFCLKCLRTYYKDRTPGVDPLCPLCGECFTMPCDGLDHLPCNCFINKMLLLRDLLDSKSDSCDWCAASGTKTPKVEYCIECGQNMCDKCSAAHKNLKSFKDHHIMTATNDAGALDQIKNMSCYCDLHPDEQVKLFCSDCNATTCMMCYVEKHNNHDCMDVKKSAEKFSKQIKEDIDKVGMCITRCEYEVHEMKLTREEFTEKVSTIRGRISQKFEYLVLLLKSQQALILEELCSFEGTHLEEWEDKKVDVEQHAENMEGFRMYGQDVVDLGTSCDISCAAYALHARAEKLLNTYAAHCTYNLSKVEVLFNPSSVQDSVSNLIGELVFPVADQSSSKPPPAPPAHTCTKSEKILASPSAENAGTCSNNYASQPPPADTCPKACPEKDDSKSALGNTCTANTCTCSNKSACQPPPPAETCKKSNPCTTTGCACDISKPPPVNTSTNSCSEKDASKHVLVNPCNACAISDKTTPKSAAVSCGGTCPYRRKSYLTPVQSYHNSCQHAMILRSSFSDYTYSHSGSQTEQRRSLPNNESKDNLKVGLFLNKSKIRYVMPDNGHVTSLTVLDGKLFVVRDMSAKKIEVYNVDNFTAMPGLIISESKCLWIIVGCSQNNCLYMSDNAQKLVHKYSLSFGVATKWSVSRVCVGLCVTSTCNVLVTLRAGSHIEEYTSDGSLVRKLHLHSSLKDPQHCIPAESDGNYLVCHGGAGNEHRVCIVDTAGSILNSYGEFKGSDVGQLNGPRQLMLDKDNNVLVADRANNRVEILSSTLTHLGYVAILDQQLNGPCTLHLDEQRQCLYIGEWGGGRVFVLNVK